MTRESRYTDSMGHKAQGTLFCIAEMSIQGDGKRNNNIDNNNAE